ncbi:MAG: NAD(P)H-hydrate dehydratase [Patescibacteria group bacterium]|nr:NAD(P)H-hydrate dehydratase [Patescibacteria group bacterium]
MSKEVTADILKEIYPDRSPHAHKYDFGHLLVVGGSFLYSGSPAFNALAAYHAGVDLVTVVAPERAADIVAGFSPDLITYPVDTKYFTPKHLTLVEDLTENKDAVVIGGGMGRNLETLEFVRRFLMRTEMPVVVDADAIYAAQDDEGIQEWAEAEMFEEKDFIVTPHAYEFYVLTGQKLPEAGPKRLELVEHGARAIECVILQKGNPDIISNGVETMVNNTGNPYMSVGGTGDTLAGLCGAYLALGLDPFTAASAAAFVNGRAGDLAADVLGPSFLATDLLAYIPQVLKETS